MDQSKRRCLLVWATCLTFACAAPAAGDTLIVDSTQSFLQLDVSIFDIPIATPQFPGSNQTAISGTLEATVVGNQLTFDGGSSLDFLEFDDGNTNLLPDVGGGSPGNPGTGAPADIGLDLVLPGLGTGVAAVRSGVADLTGGPVTVTAGVFDASSLTLGLLAGFLDANLDTSVGDVVESLDISGNTADNTDAGDGFTEVVSGVRRVIVPIDVTVVLDVEVAEGVVLPIAAAFTGQVVTVPEPGTMSLLAMACAGLLANGYRHRRRCRRKAVRDA